MELLGTKDTSLNYMTLDLKEFNTKFNVKKSS